MVLPQEIKENDILILAVSGGADSMFLLYEALEWQKKMTLTLVVAHLNHNVRGKESQADLEFVKDAVKNINIKQSPSIPLIFESGKLLAKTHASEELLRLARYEFLEKTRKKYKGDWIITAHHLNDSIETMLFQLARGTFINGLTGIKAVDRKRHLLRPLLHLTKKEILENLKKNNISYREDSSNTLLQFSRNRIRQKIVPEFKNINPSFEKTMVQALQSFNEINDYLKYQTQQWLKTNYQKNQMSEQTFLALHPILQKEILAEIYRQLYGSTEKFNQAHVEQILKVIQAKKSGKAKEFGAKYWISIKKVKNERTVFISTNRG